jgi:hypothetical protein
MRNIRNNEGNIGYAGHISNSRPYVIQGDSENYK